MPRNLRPRAAPVRRSARVHARRTPSSVGPHVRQAIFIGSLDGHRDSVTCLSKHPSRLSQLYTGAADGEARIWDLAQMRCIRNIQAHEATSRDDTPTTAARVPSPSATIRRIKRWR